MQAQVQLKWSDLQKDDNILQNYDQQPKLAYLEENVKKVNKVRFIIGSSQTLKVMIGICDKKIRQQRGMIFQDKSFVGHGTYLLYSVNSYNSFLFSHWDLEVNYNEGGFVMKKDDQIEVSFNLDNRILKITDVNKTERSVEFQTEHHNMEDLHLCVVIIDGDVQFYQ
ncbi:unnamed protein product [Paramecium sonneborni]|uniref:Uncharacterized protein n=1 Tax=Paramecium sonneborni TaxID=65129 RepID=A0A8S1PG26_9CILI|nr:unnamed protein product [Paramecium sonneborni]